MGTPPELCPYSLIKQPSPLGQAQISNVNANTIYTQGVDAAQNTNITSALGLAASAFLTANAALPQSGGTITNSLSIGKDLTVSGNLTVLGNATSLAVTQLDIYDSLIYLANNNFTSDAVDIGIIGHYNAGVNAHSGIFRDPVRKEWIFFQGYTPEVQANNLINIADPSFAYANVYANYFKGNLIATGGITFGDSTVQTTAGSSVANTIYLQGALNSANANIGVLYGIETSQNTNIGLAWNLANTALQNTSIITLSSDLVIPGNLTVGGSSILNAISAANANISLLFNIDNYQNTAIQNAYNQANSANILAQAAFNKANTSTSGLGWAANTVIVANQSGYLSNTSNLLYFASNNSLLLSGNNNSISNTTGTIVVTGGAGVSGNLYANAIYTDWLFYNANGLPWVMGSGGGGGGSSTLAGLTDVSISSPANNQALLYNSSTNKWNNSTFLFDKQYTKLGVLTPFVDQSNRWYPSTNVVINSILVTLGSAPTGSNASISVCKNATPFTTITIVAGTNTGNTYNTPITANVGDYINMIINNGGATTSGSDLYVTLRYYRT